MVVSTELPKERRERRNVGAPPCKQPTPAESGESRTRRQAIVASPPPRSLQVALVELKIVDLDEVSLKIVRLSAGDPQPVTQGGAGTLTDIP